jgi:acetyl/propionyl-CoA carboxylase alpha subunit
MASRHRFQLGDESHTVLVDEVDGRLSVQVDDDAPVLVDATASGIPGLVSMIVDDRPSRAYVSRQGGGYRVVVDGRAFDVVPAGAGRRQRGAVGGASDPPGKVTAPLAGVVVDVRVEAGAAFEAGESLVVIEAMKMQNEVQAPHAGKITAVHCAKGGRVEKGELLVEYEVTE